jgi:RNA recognition motif-containing protein
VQIITRGPRSAGYGFVSLANAEAAEKAVESLDKQELDGRTVIVEIAKPSDQKDREKKERKKSRRPGRRGAKPIPGEVTEAEANGEPSKADGAAVPESSEAAKPKRKKKKSGVCLSHSSSVYFCSLVYSAQAQEVHTNRG